MSDESMFWPAICTVGAIEHALFYGRYAYCHLCKKINPRLQTMGHLDALTTNPGAVAATGASSAGESTATLSSAQPQDSLQTRPVINFNPGAPGATACGTSGPRVPAVSAPSKTRSHDSFASINNRVAQQQRALGFRNNLPPVTNAASPAVAHRPATPVSLAHKRKKKSSDKASAVDENLYVEVNVYKLDADEFEHVAEWEDAFPPSAYPADGISAHSSCFTEWILSRSPFSEYDYPEDIERLQSIWPSRGLKDGVPLRISPKTLEAQSIEQLVAIFPPKKDHKSRRITIVVELKPKVPKKKAKKAKKAPRTIKLALARGVTGSSESPASGRGKTIKAEPGLAPLLQQVG